MNMTDRNLVFLERTDIYSDLFSILKYIKNIVYYTQITSKNSIWNFYQIIFDMNSGKGGGGGGMMSEAEKLVRVVSSDPSNNNLLSGRH